EETLALESGSCRDTAWLLVQVLRHLGLAARFVSGYLIQLTPDVKPLEGPAGPPADFTDLHAWTEVYLPGAGWIGLDPTSGLLAGEGHIPLAATPDPFSAAPVTGSVDDCETVFTHDMEVRRIHESPRVTKPYTDEEWREVESVRPPIDVGPWRRGQASWDGQAPIADEAIDYGQGEGEARRFIVALAKLLGVDPKHVIPAYEDVWHYLWNERRLPTNVDPLTSELRNAEERARLS